MIYFNFPKSVYLKYREKINKTILNVLNSGNYVKSKELNKFEKKFAQYIKTKFAVGVGNATDAIFVALKALNIGYGDEIITVSHTATGTAMGILNTGAKPVFCDISKRDFNIDISLISKKITKKTKAIVIVHLYGQSCEMKDLLYLAKKKGLPVIEDCSQSTGGKYKKRYLGSLGVFGCFSFFPTKNLSCIGDGGMITTNDSFYYKKINYLREYGWDENRNAQLVGINSRLDEIQAAILNVKLKYLNKDNNERRSIANYYNKNINNYKILKPLEKPNCYHVYHLYVIRCKNRDKLIRELRKKEIFAGIHYTKAVHQQQLFDGNKNYLPITDKISKEVLSLPIYPGLRKKSLKKVIDVINNF